MEKKAVVSLIIPVYNVEKYLKRCLDSVCAQDEKNFECILVDDGSTDTSGKICDEYADRDSRFHVIHQENGGVSSARNRGIEAAEGRYIIFCDSDDEILPSYLSSFTREKEDYDMIIAGVLNIEADGRRHYGTAPQEKEVCKTGTEDIREMVDNKAINRIYSKRFRKTLISENGICFDSNYSLGEDTLFVGEYLLVCSNMKYINSCCYHYYKYPADRKSLSDFNEHYVDRLCHANAVIGGRLALKYEGIKSTESWRRRLWDVYYYGIFNVLRDDTIRPRRKFYMLRRILKRKDIAPFLKDLDFYMATDAKIWRNVIQTRCSFAILTVWYLNRMYLGVRSFTSK